jgi:hypothetical protein
VNAPIAMMSRYTARTMSALLLLAMFVSGTVAQTAPTEDVGTNTLAAMTPTSAEWTALSADPTETVVAVTSAGSCVCDLTEGSCDGNCCCDEDCTVRIARTRVLERAFHSPRAECHF